ncbi:Calcium-binding and coiled-coil domain containing protein 2 [Dissostichus eleginoides]|uniref:Calcium-binding and coiled-coil domain containing protein 2 n=1 Tax=Dissostichus eleginoides TaxID=100907 RepID=A0AAD9BMU3_DISEL|nr:Calcium-binding and coiled-coil domain containing protein 2 [Dissostichus eleginoides]
MCCKHAAGGSILTFARSLSSRVKPGAPQGSGFGSSLFPPSQHPSGLPLYMTSEPLDSLAQLWPEQSGATPRNHPTFLKQKHRQQGFLLFRDI